MLPMALLVFRTVRTGFPTAEIIVYGNGLRGDFRDAVAMHTMAVGGTFRDDQMIAHGVWIERLLSSEREPFWICDTDVIFFGTVQYWFKDEALFTGRLEPTYRDPLTRMQHVARLHPSMMWFNPDPLRVAMRAWPEGGAQEEVLNTVECSLIRWNYVPATGQQPIFYDTCAGLHQALGGRAFTESQNAAFEHLFCGTYSDVMAKVMDVRGVHAAAWQAPLGREHLWKHQQQWYVDNV